jgi:methionyl-tRNA formyltransferase
LRAFLTQSWRKDEFSDSLLVLPQFIVLLDFYMSLRIIFAGTPEFSVSALKSLIASEHQVCAVYTQPDRPAGRGRKLKASPIKEVAFEHGIDVFQPISLKNQDEIDHLVNLNADLMVVVAYGLILPKAILDAPKFGCINIHASILPRWRGAAPIQRAIYSGDAETGITIMQMNEGLDTGDMLLKKICPISSVDNSQVLHDKLSLLGADALLEVLPSIINQSLRPEVQDNSLVVYAEKITKNESTINWQNKASNIQSQVQAFNPWPVAQTLLDKKVLRIWESEVVLGDVAGMVAGTVMVAGKQGIDVVTGENILRLTQVQLPGKRSMNAADLVNSRNIRDVVLG